MRVRYEPHCASVARFAANANDPESCGLAAPKGLTELTEAEPPVRAALKPRTPDTETELALHTCMDSLLHSLGILDSHLDKLLPCNGVWYASELDKLLPRNGI